MKNNHPAIGTMARVRASAGEALPHALNIDNRAETDLGESKSGLLQRRMRARGVAVRASIRLGKASAIPLLYSFGSHRASKLTMEHVDS